MQTSKTLITTIGLLAGSPCAHADTAILSHAAGKLTGSLQAIRKDGVVEWNSPYSKQPLKLLAGRIEQMEFSTSPESSEPSPIQITLRNGDIIPASIISKLGEAGLVTDTSIAGQLTIPRAALASAQFGITNRKVIYSGFENIRDWTTGKGEPDNWKQNGNKLTSTGGSIAARDFEMPENFAIKFELSWDNRAPNYSVGFADPLSKNPSKQNLYRFNFDSSGMRIQRQSNGENRARTLAQWQRRPSEFSDKKMRVEIRVDRGKRQIELLINGDSEGVVVDPLGDIPTGSGVSFACRTSTGGRQTIGQLSISELHDNRKRHLAEERGDASVDCLITTDDDRWSGELTSLLTTEDEHLMVFKTKFSEEAWEIPEEEISTIFFANNPFKGSDGEKPNYHIEFHGSGNLSINDLIIENDRIEALHPILGSLQIPRGAVKLIRLINQ